MGGGVHIRGVCNRMYFLGLQVDGLITWGAFKWCEGGGGGLKWGVFFCLQVGGPIIGRVISSGGELRSRRLR